MSTPEAVDQNIQVRLLGSDLVPLMCLQWLNISDVENEEAHSKLGRCKRVCMEVKLGEIIPEILSVL